MNTVKVRLIFRSSVFRFFKAVTMATSHLMKGRYIPRFGLNSLISILSFGEIFSYFATSWKWYCLTFWIGKKSRLFRWFFQYSVVCHSSKYIRLVLRTDFNKNKVFYRKCMWLELSQILKKFTEGNARKFTVSLLFVLMLTSLKSRNTDVSFERAQITRNKCFCGNKACLWLEIWAKWNKAWS